MYDRLRRYNMSETDQIVSKLKEICVKYTDILGLVILFGSFSRGEATKRSDIDLYVESKDLKMTTGKLMSSKRYRMSVTTYMKASRKNSMCLPSEASGTPEWSGRANYGER